MGGGLTGVVGDGDSGVVGGGDGDGDSGAVGEPVSCCPLSPGSGIPVASLPGTPGPGMPVESPDLSPVSAVGPLVSRCLSAGVCPAVSAGDSAIEESCAASVGAHAAHSNNTITIAARNSFREVFISVIPSII